MMKILIVRFSSIGDIVLTTPVVRCLKQQKAGVEIHYLTFSKYASLLVNNPYIDKIITIEKTIREVIPELKQNHYDLVVDLHRNIRTFSLKIRLLRPSVTFNKLNRKKYLLVRLGIDRLPAIHLVDRYFKALKPTGILNDNLGLDYFPANNDHGAESRLPTGFVSKGYVIFVIGGRYLTKIFPSDKVSEIVDQLNFPVVLLGGKEDYGRGEEVRNLSGKEKVFNGCGQFSLNESAALISGALLVISNDTGMMHVAAAFRKKIISLWGNTVPAFGMYPYMPKELLHRSIIVEDKNVTCRPCSKLGFAKCPKKHFNCMKNISADKVLNAVDSLLAQDSGASNYR